MIEAATDTRRGRPILWVLAVVAVALIVVGVALASRFGDDPGLVSSPLIGRPAPAVTLPLLEAEGALALDQGPGRITVVNFWASWCLPCRQEHPGLVEAAALYERRGVEFVGVLYQDRPSSAARFLDELGRGYTYVNDPRSRAAIEFGVFGVPETFFIDGEGTVVAKISGPADPSLLTATLDAIILGESVDSVQTGPVQSRPEE